MDPKLIAQLGPPLKNIGRGFTSVAPGISQIAGGFAANRQAGVNADRLREFGDIEAGETRRAGRRLAGSQIAAFAASGVDPGSGSAIDIAAETAAETELAALRAQFGFDERAFVEEQAGRSALISGLTRGTGTIISQLQEEFVIPEESDFSGSRSGSRSKPSAPRPPSVGKVKGITDDRGVVIPRARAMTVPNPNFGSVA